MARQIHGAAAVNLDAEADAGVYFLPPGPARAAELLDLIDKGWIVKLGPGSYGIETTLAGINTTKFFGVGYGLTTFDVAGGVTLGVTEEALSAIGVGDPPDSAGGLFEGTDVTITAGGNNLAPNDIETSGALLIDPAAALTITGLDAADASGRVLFVANISATAGRTATLLDESASSTAANRIRTPNAQPFVLQPGAGCVLRYSGSRWHVLGALSPTMSFGRAASGAGGDLVIKPNLGAVDNTDLGGKIRMYVGVPVPNSASPSAEVQIRLEDETVIFCLKQIGGPASQLYFGNNGALRSGIITGSNLTLEVGTTVITTAPTSITHQAPLQVQSTSARTFRRIYLGSAATTDATATNVVTFTLASGESARVCVTTTIGNDTDDTGGSIRTAEAHFYNAAGTVTQQGSTTEVGTSFLPAAIAAAVHAVDFSGTTIRTRFTGVAGKNLTATQVVEVTISTFT